MKEDRPTMRKNSMNPTKQEKNKALVLEAFDTLFNKRDYAAAERFWSPDYIQHSAHIAPGREGLFNLIKSIPPTLKYEPGTIMAEGDLVIVHGRFSGFGAPVNWIAADIVRIQNGILVEHWDVIEDEATEEQSVSKRPMFGTHSRHTNESERGEFATTQQQRTKTMAKKLEGKTAVISGGTEGIGLATAKLFVKEGAYVFITGRRQKELDEAVKAIGTNGSGVQGDVANLADLDRLYQTVSKVKGRIDIVFANAGVGEFVPFGAVTEEHF